MVEPNPDFLNELKTKGRNAWILPHCLSVIKNILMFILINLIHIYIHNLHILYVVSYYQVTQRSEVVEFDAHMFNGGIINSGKIEKHIYELRPLRKILLLISVFYEYLFSSTLRRQKS